MQSVFVFSYSKLVNQGMEKAELIVKVSATREFTIDLFSLFQMVMSPHDQAEEFISHYFSIMQRDTDVSSFQKILDMKVQYSIQHWKSLFLCRV